MYQRKGFTLIELLITVTIIGILVTLVTVSVLPVQKKARDSKRKADISLFTSGLSLFNSDFKVYPNPTFYLGSYTNSDKAKNSNFGLAADIVSCNGAVAGATANFTNPATPTPTVNQLDTTAISLKDGFVSTNNFLVCLKYMTKILQDSIFVGLDQYQYRVNYDYSEYLVGAKLENQNDIAGKLSLFPDGATFSSKWYFDGSGISERSLDDDTDVNGEFYSLTNSGTQSDGRYFYQCVLNGLGATIDEDDRPNIAPLINNGTSWVANTGTTAQVCQNNINANTVSKSSY